MPVVYFRAEFDRSQSAQSASSILRSRSIIDRPQFVGTTGAFPQTCVRPNLLRVCMRVAEIQITIRSLTIAPKITARELVSRARVYRASTRSNDSKEGEKDETRGSEQVRKKGKEEEKESDRPRGRSHPEFEVGGRTCNRVS